MTAGSYEEGRNPRLASDVTAATGSVPEIHTQKVIATLDESATATLYFQNANSGVAVQATPDYSDGDNIGGLITLTDYARLAAGSGRITSIVVTSEIAIASGLTVHIFDANPSASTTDDNDAIAIAAADLPKIIWSGTITPAAVGGQFVGVASIDVPYSLAAGRDLYVAFEANETLNFGATTDLAVRIAGQNA